MEAMYAKMWDPPTASPATPELIAPTNPVPAFMEATLGGQFEMNIPNTVERDLLHGETLTAWDGKQLFFMTFRDSGLNSPLNGGHWPGPTIRVPRGVIYHCETQGHGPPPHTIHWHGHEPTPMNDGVGHCSMELGRYTYQWQPNFMGTYFHHCHRNTVQHFEFGLYGMTLIEAPDAYDAAYDGKNPGGYPRRVQANLSFPDLWPALGITNPVAEMGFNGNALTDPDPGLVYDTDPHAMTVLYDQEVLWVADDRDSVWSDLASNARAFYPGVQGRPGVDDFHPHGFFNNFNADYWYVTGASIPVPRRPNKAAPVPVGDLGTGIVVPAALNSGVAGLRVDVAAAPDQTVLVRLLNGAYNCIEVSFPVDVVIIAWDGRALGVPPFGIYNRPYVVPAGQKIHMSVARRFDALIRIPSGDPRLPLNDFANIDFIDTRGQGMIEVPGFDVPGLTLATGRIPINIA
jgi:hypothetical protein